MLGMEGPCGNIDTACSSALVALNAATLGLGAGAAVLVAAANLILQPRVSVLLVTTVQELRYRYADDFRYTIGCALPVQLSSKVVLREVREAGTNVLSLKATPPWLAVETVEMMDDNKNIYIRYDAMAMMVRHASDTL